MSPRCPKCGIRLSGGGADRQFGDEPGARLQCSGCGYRGWYLYHSSGMVPLPWEHKAVGRLVGVVICGALLLGAYFLLRALGVL